MEKRKIKKSAGSYKDPDLQSTKLRIRILVEDWDKYYSPKFVLQDILDSWPEDYPEPVDGGVPK